MRSGFKYTDSSWFHPVNPHLTSLPFPSPSPTTMLQDNLAGPSSPHSSHLSQLDFPPLPLQKTPPASTWSKRSWMWGQKGDQPSTVSTKRSWQSLLPDFLKGSKEPQLSPPLGPLSSATSSPEFPAHNSIAGRTQDTTPN
ncbi:hypothetical protein EV421DRAFT_1900052 [Armillaria borealis]|uniref:Uncharacterized protein n=1 Tax=Armillaria borealis TaxID=47425 RepID=A0AA39JV43_9AGAR|nr:hypothetical protein EV421DRAFT_1900052 [Armillaria borealis]